jgi:pyruvate ferredoxin oxidoreductase gamma subunit
MYRIRFHGRGGQGMKTASRILGTAFFTEGFEVQDAPRYGAERRGAPIFAYVRAGREPIHERGIIRRPDLVAVADETLLGVATAGVLSGVDEDTVLLLNSPDEPAVWRERLHFAGSVLTLGPEAVAPAEERFVGTRCAAAAARLVGGISREALERAVREELADLGPDRVEANLARAVATWEALAAESGSVREGVEPAVGAHAAPPWVELPFEPVRVSAPDIHGGPTSVQVRTGLWRTMRPVIDLERCHRCSWICSTFCPDGALLVDADRTPRIDYDHCKGCLVCVAVCPHHAIEAVPEREAVRTEPT